MSKVRFQFEMSEDNAKHFQDLAKSAGVTKRDLVNNALTLLDWSIKEAKEGRRIASVDANKQDYREVVLPLINAFLKEPVSA